MGGCPSVVCTLSTCREEDPDEVPHGHITSLVGTLHTPLVYY